MFSSQYLTTYEHPIKIPESSVSTIKNTTNGYIYVFLIRTLAHGNANNTSRTHQNASTGYPLRLYNLLSYPKHPRKSPETKTPQSHISNRRFQILMKKITLNVMNLTSHVRDYAERAVPEYTEYIIILFIIEKFLYVLIYLVPNYPSRAIVKDPFARYFTILTSTLFVSILHNHEYGGVLDILIMIKLSSTRYSTKKISNKIPWMVSHPKVSWYFPTLLILNSKFRIITVPHIYL